jgi:hypothetical protein
MFFSSVYAMPGNCGMFNMTYGCAETLARAPIVRHGHLEASHDREFAPTCRWSCTWEAGRAECLGFFRYCVGCELWHPLESSSPGEHDRKRKSRTGLDTCTIRCNSIHTVMLFKSFKGFKVQISKPKTKKYMGIPLHQKRPTPIPQIHFNPSSLPQDTQQHPPPSPTAPSSLATPYSTCPNLPPPSPNSS